MRHLLFFPAFVIVVLLLIAQSFGHGGLKAQGYDYGRMARPELEEGHKVDREKADWDRYVLAGPISRETGLFLNSNTILESLTSPAPQNESSIAISPIDPDYLIASAVDSRPGAWVYISRDGGKSWENLGFGVVNDVWQTGNDPSVGFDHDGNAYVMYGAFPRPFTGESGVYIAKSTDKGKNWTPHITVIEHKGDMTPDSAFEDKYYIEIDRSPTSPYRGWIYTPWKRVTDRDSATEIVFARSTDGGLTWSEPIGISPRKPGTSTHITFGQSFPLVKAGANGEIYAVWNDGPARSIGFARSTDGGETWSDPTYPVTGYEYLGTERFIVDGNGDTTERYHVLKGTFRAETYPTVAVDYSNSSRRGWIYLCWSAGKFPDVHFIRSTDGGATWSQPKIIQSEAFGDQWWPWISVDETNGDIAVMYSDSRNDLENIFIDTYVSYSNDGGDTWIDRIVTDAVSDFRDNPFVNQIFAGDYSGNAFYDGRIYPAFLDTRDDNDVYTAVVDVRKPWPVENFRVGSRIDDLTEAQLRWMNPPLETVFGIPVDDYALLLERDGAFLAELASGTTEYVENGLTLDQEYTYSIRVLVGEDTSEARTVDFRSGGARLPAPPTVESFRQYQPTIEVSLRLPTVRADSVTTYSNLTKYRIYRDGVLLREIDVAPSDSGSLANVEDTPNERGYYRYSFSTVDGAEPPNESPLSDTVVLYAGNLGEFFVNFDDRPSRFLNSGTWAETNVLAFSNSTSFTDSPDGNYRPRQDYSAVIYPVLAEQDNFWVLSFEHICIVLNGDSALVEVSADTGKTWQLLRSYGVGDHAEWMDRTADPDDWKHESLQYSYHHPQGQPSLLLFRFRMVTSALSHADGWFIDDLIMQLTSLSVEEESTSGVAITLHPNPTRGNPLLSFRLQEPSEVSFQLYDELGREVEVRIGEPYEAGAHMIPIKTSRLPPGVYFWRMQTTSGSEQGRLVLVR